MAFIIQKLADEGSSESYYTRLWIGIFKLRDQALQFVEGDIELKHLPFDERYKPVLEASGAARAACQKLVAAVQQHRLKLQDSVKRQPNAIEIPDSIQIVLADNIRSFLVNGVIAIKRCQEVTRLFGIDIGSVFTKQVNFEKGLETMRNAHHNALAEYLLSTRNIWSESLIKRRDELEHSGWTLPDCGYNQSGVHSVELIEPQVDGEPVSIYAPRMLNRIISFVENTIVYAIQSFLPKLIILVEIPRSERDTDKPVRFRVSLRGTNEREWQIVYSENDFP